MLSKKSTKLWIPISISKKIFILNKPKIFTNFFSDRILRNPCKTNRSTSLSPRQTIEFDSSLTGETIVLTSGRLILSSEITINGLGAEELTLDAGGNSSLFAVNDGNPESNIEVGINGITITGGQQRVAGAIENRENLTITESSIANNSSLLGGAIVNESGELTIIDSNISNNTAGNGGGGIFVRGGNTNIADSIFSNNQSGSFGGGIFIAAPEDSVNNINNSVISDNVSTLSGAGFTNFGGEINITNSTILGNRSTNGSGGAILNVADLNITNSTISGNTAFNRGGAINQASLGLLTISNSTITGNSATNTAGGLASYAGPNNTSQVIVANTIISGNFNTPDVALFGSEPLTNNITSSGGNLIGTGNVLEFFNQPTDQINIINPGLAPLGDNGGPTPTHLPLADSPAIDAGVNALIPPGVTTDQRGLDRIFNETVDVGAVEIQVSESNEDQEIQGTFRNDTLTGGLGNDTILGLTGNDSLLGLEGNDSIIGGLNNDTLVGGLGNDTLVGGLGRNWFRFDSPEEGIDTITDFRVRNNLIAVSGSGFDNFGTPLISNSSLPPELFAQLGSITSEAVFVYDPTDGDLFYRRGSIETPETIQLASLSPGLNLNSSNFWVTSV
ncbi:calcium-binding protein [Gloeocapsa sp. PCC 73106]|uniref:calcium-binding protein n=1 Tax=Gloeocapsa sp. PCC 73106 TaxID=102232 RepID=UPI0002ACA04E|nr:calcium-binding protein [Gloeocapsa sp. PCC 73106]ELR99943.1 Ca2+-binding protein, RTX toxin [Gloeocapsa sp. PCC 73106]